MAEDLTDFDCWDDLSLFDTDLSDPFEVLAQDVYHILVEAPGSNIDDPDRGIGILDRLSSTVDPSLAHQIDAQIQKDDRVDSSETTITERSAGVFLIDIRVHTNNEVIDLSFVSDSEGFRRGTT